MLQLFINGLHFHRRVAAYFSPNLVINYVSAIGQWILNVKPVFIVCLYWMFNTMQTCKMQDQQKTMQNT